MHLPIIKYKHIFLGLGLLIILGSVAILGTFGLRLGIDFTGGSLTEVVYEDVPEQSVVEEEVVAVTDDGTSVRTTTSGDGREGYMIRSRDLSEEERQEVESVLLGLGSDGEIIRFTSIGPVIGQELADKAQWAIAGVSIIIILYIALAFMRVGYPVRSWVYGGITVVALAHDVLVPTALMAILGLTIGAEVDVLFVTAILAVLGYSVNDTIVVFDRVRENLQKYRVANEVEVKDATGVMQKETTYTLTKPFADIVNESVNQTVTRSINTSLTTLLALSALYFFGGVTTQIFALILMAGVIAGTYSSLFLANPLLVYYAEKFVGFDTKTAGAEDPATATAAAETTTKS